MRRRLKNCYPDVLDVLHAAQDEFYGEFALDEERVANLEEVCQLVDHLADRFEAEYVDSEVDERNKILSLSMEVDEMILRDADMKSFLSLARKAIRFSMKCKRQKVFIRFDLGGLWSLV